MTTQNSKTISQTNTSDWQTAIAKQSKVTPDKVKTVLNRLGIRPSPLPATPAHLTLTHLEFRGEKRGTEPPAKDGPFHFTWKDLKTGAWAMMTDENLRGKSSVFEIVKWLLRGEPSSALQADVQGWLDEARLDFKIGGEDYRVETSFKEGESEGRILQIKQGKSDLLPLATFSTASDFKEIMSSFFMKHLELDIIQAFRKDSEHPATHEWPTLSGALFIGTNYTSLLGEIVTDGLPGRLLQMYLGLPWISTLSSAKSALKGFQAEQNERRRYAEEGQKSQEERLTKIENQLSEKKRQLQTFPSPEQVRIKHRTLTYRVGEIGNETRKLESLLTEAKKSQNEASNAYNEDRRELQFFQEDEATGAIFRALDPEICPRCEVEISEARRKQEHTSHECSVCGERMVYAEDDTQEIMKKLRDRVKASAQALKMAKNAVEELKKRLQTLSKEASKTDMECTELSNALSGGFNEYYDVFGEIRALEGEREFLTQPQEIPKEPISDEQAILEATIKEIEKLVSGLKAELLSKTSKHITRLARDFGMSAITEAKLKGNASLQIIKGGQTTTYSKLTGGEKLRLKVATVLAIISVAESRGLGRHPGLLFIDSPKNHQMIDDDFDHLLDGLKTAIRSLPHLQVFLASTSSLSLREWIDPKRLKHAQGDSFLW